LGFFNFGLRYKKRNTKNRMKKTPAAISPHGILFVGGGAGAGVTGTPTTGAGAAGTPTTGSLI
jgi:hypothetical protein